MDTYKLSLVALCLLCVLTVHAESCERPEAELGCTVDDGHAQCEAWNITASVLGLPSCTTELTFSLLLDPRITDWFNYISLRDVTFTHLPGLKVLTIYTKREIHARILLRVDDFVDIQSLKNLQTLRIQMMMNGFSFTKSNAGMFKRLKSLEILEIARSPGAGLLYCQHEIGPNPSMKALILKNVQTIATYQGRAIFNLDFTFYACGSNVQYLDLTYNDIVAISVKSGCWSNTLRFVNLNHNLLTHVYPGMHFYMYMLPMLAGIEVFHCDLTGPTHYEGLWEEVSDVRTQDLAVEHKAGSDISTSLLHNSHLPFLVGYEFWLKDMLSNCEELGFIDFTRCSIQNDDENGFVECLDPKLKCLQGENIDIVDKVKCVLKHKCNYNDSCGFELPLIPNLKSMSGRYMGYIRPITLGNLLCENYSVKFLPNNELEYIDLSYAKFDGINLNLERLTLSGLSKLKYVNVHGMTLPILLSKFNVSKMEKLEELHMGGNHLAEHDVIPSHIFQAFPKLHLLNLTGAYLKGFEADTFLNLNHLAVLDLSHNDLNASALTDLDLSHTSLKSLNLSQNKLAFIPRALCLQLENMEGLQLYLSGNQFICSCENLEFLLWIQSEKAITFHFSGDHVCLDSPGNTIHNIEVDSLYCNWYWMQAVIIIPSILTGVLLFAAVGQLYKKRWHISNLVFRLRERLCRSSEQDSATSYTYDAFVLYSSVDIDRQWVHYRMPNILEDVYGFRLCIHHRDFLGGFDIVDNIEKAIRSSRKVVAVVSENFLRSDWCIEEVQMTKSIDRKKLVVIMYKDVLFSGVYIPPVMRFLLESTTYVEWNEDPEAEKLFWKKLRKALYSKHQLSQSAEEDQETPHL